MAEDIELWKTLDRVMKLVDGPVQTGSVFVQPSILAGVSQRQLGKADALRKYCELAWNKNDEDEDHVSMRELKNRCNAIVHARDIPGFRMTEGKKGERREMDNKWHRMFDASGWNYLDGDGTFTSKHPDFMQWQEEVKQELINIEITLDRFLNDEGVNSIEHTRRQNILQTMKADPDMKGDKDDDVQASVLQGFINQLAAEKHNREEYQRETIAQRATIRKLEAEIEKLKAVKRKAYFWISAIAGEDNAKFLVKKSSFPTTKEGQQAIMNGLSTLRQNYASTTLSTMQEGVLQILKETETQTLMNANPDELQRRLQQAVAKQNGTEKTETMVLPPGDDGLSQEQRDDLEKREAARKRNRRQRISGEKNGSDSESE